jgi:hypothetical protein
MKKMNLIVSMACTGLLLAATSAFAEDTATAPVAGAKGAVSEQLHQEKAQVKADREKLKADRQKLRADRKSARASRKAHRQEKKTN